MPMKIIKEWQFHGLFGKQFTQWLDAQKGKFSVADETTGDTPQKREASKEETITSKK